MSKSTPNKLAYQKARYQKISKDRAEKGLCSMCGKVRTNLDRICCSSCISRSSGYQKKARHRLRKEGLDKYGNECACCGEKTEEFLTFDHVNNDGAEHRKMLKSKDTVVLLRWLKKNNWPDVIQILCWNCNAAKQYFGECPHKTEQKEKAV